MRSTLTTLCVANVYGVPRIAAALAALAISVAAVPATAAADPPTRITIVAVFDPIDYGENAYVNGQLIGEGQGGQPVALEQSAPPFTDWAPVAQAAADAQGYYSFKLHPTQTLQYRTSSQGLGSERVVQVSVAPRIRLKAEAVGRSSVRFSGTVAPALEGQTVAIQRRLASGSWSTVTNARLHDGKTFAGRFRTRKPTTLRAYFESDGAHADGYSNVVKVTPGHSATATAAACRTPSITRIATAPSPALAGRITTLRVGASLPGGKLYAIDVRWGDGDARDHLTLAPAVREPRVVFSVRHRYPAAKTYPLRITVYGKTGTCRTARTRHPQLTVAAP